MANKPTMVKLRRVESTPDGTIGILYVQDEFVSFAVERPWANNAPNVSCIPNKWYDLAWADSPKFGRRLHVRNVPDRSHILIHAGNSQRDTSGCILPVMKLGHGGPRAKWRGFNGTSSRLALDKLEALLPDDGTVYQFQITDR